jgi:hypothetical protein
VASRMSSRPLSSRVAFSSRFVVSPGSGVQADDLGVIIGPEMLGAASQLDTIRGAGDPIADISAARTASAVLDVLDQSHFISLCNHYKTRSSQKSGFSASSGHPLGDGDGVVGRPFGMTMFRSRGGAGRGDPAGARITPSTGGPAGCTMMVSEGPLLEPRRITILGAAAAVRNLKPGPQCRLRRRDYGGRA